NAFETGRIPQAWILTGVRGVGKTTTARILARALNYEPPDGSITGPTINMPVLGVHCQAIMESRHLDVIEMDAASHNSVEDVRQMLGLGDRGRVIELFEALMRGDIAAALAELRAQYDTGADPAVVLTDLADFTHFVTRVKIVPAVAEDRSLIEIERARGRACAEKLSMRVLSRTW